MVMRERTDGPTLQPPRRLVWLAALLVAALTFVAYVPALDNEFVNWDDDHNLTNNENYRGFDGERLRWMFTSFHMAHYHPLTWVSFGVDHALWGMDPRGYHLTNVLLHAGTAVAVLFFALAVFRRLRGGGPGKSSLLVASFAAACIFALHPLRVESVAWATERRDCLSGLFFFLSLNAYLAYAGSARRSRYALALVFLLLSLLSKAWGITIPVVLLLLDVYPLRRLELRTCLSRRSWHVWLEKVPFAALAAASAALAVWGQSDSGAMRSLANSDLGQRVAQSAYGLVWYVAKTVWPSGLAPIYDRPPGISLLDPPYLAAAAIVLAYTAAAIRWRARFPAALAVWCGYIVVVSPMLGIVQVGSYLVADRYSYLACIGWALLGGAGVAWLWARRPPVGAATLVAVVATLGALTWRQADVWQDSETLWARVLEVDPDSATGHQYRAGLLYRDGQLELAAEHYKKSLQAAPSRPKVHENLGVTYVNLGRYRDAEGHLLRALEVRLTVASLRALAVAQLALGREELPRTLRTLLQVAPGDEQVQSFVESIRRGRQRR